jgi:uncharacterized protein YqgC (DUF456 family)
MILFTSLAIAVILMIPGVVAIFFMLPGMIYIFVLALIFGFIDKFTNLTANELYILAGIAVLTIIIDQLAGIIGAKWGGARAKTFLYGIGGATLGIIIFPPLGVFIGLFIGILVGELMGKRSRNQAIKAATAGVIGTVTGIIINSVLAVIFIGLFVWFALA